ncbi:MAG: Rid family hydrolase, partial [Desulfobulbus sp.]
MDPPPYFFPIKERAMIRIPVHTEKAPAAVGPYSQAIATDSLLFTSGVIPIDPRTGKIPEADIETHAH